MADDNPELRNPQPRLNANHANHTWRLWVSNHPIGSALLAGFLATHVATIIGYWFGGVGLPQFIWPIVNGHVVLPNQSPTAQFVIGEVFIHGLDGVVFTLIYAVVLFPMFGPLFGNRVNSVTNMGKALLFSIILATISAGFLTPYVYEAGHHAGIFSTGLGWKVTLAIYLWHIAYGVNLGMLYNPLERRPLERTEPFGGRDVEDGRREPAITGAAPAAATTRSPAAPATPPNGDRAP